MGAPSKASAAAPEAAAVQKPKKAVTAYWLYSNEVRDEVIKAQKEANGGKVKFGDTAKEISSKWAAISEAEKKVYEDKAAADKQRYAAEWKAFLEASDPAGTLRQKYQHMIPKKPLTPYFVFSQDPVLREKATQSLKDEGKDASNKQVVSKLAEMWKAASPEVKAPFEERHKKEQAEFLEKQKAWQATPEFAEIEKAQRAQEEQRKAETEQQAAEAKEPEKEAKTGKKRSRSAPAAERTPKAAKEPKEKTPAQSAPAAESKRPKKGGKKEEPAPQIDAGVLAQAAKLGFEGALKNLAARPEVAASGKSSEALLAALQTSNGLVNPAKRALLGA